MCGNLQIMVPKMIELAGENTSSGNLEDDGSRSSSVNMQMEEFYATAKGCRLFQSITVPLTEASDGGPTSWKV